MVRLFKKLDRFDRDKIDRSILDYDKIVACRQQLWSLSLAARKEIPGLPKLRADVILMGVLIYELIMAEFGFLQVRVSTRGLRFAAVMSPVPVPAELPQQFPPQRNRLLSPPCAF